KDYRDFVVTANGISQTDTLFSNFVKDLVVFADKILKDQKMAASLGLKVTESYPCSKGKDCHEYLEHPYSGLAREALIKNLEAIDHAFNGSKNKSATIYDFSLNRYLEEAGVTITKDNKGVQVSELIETFSALPEGSAFYGLFANAYTDSDSDLVIKESNQAFQAFQELKQLTDWLKTDFVMDLNTNLPGTVQGDND
ncbi:MAG: hypothetical protein AAF203_03865, partial [Pseudomonadota bacterium]